MLNSRIPAFDATTSTGMRAWFKAMARRGLLFHPDDSPDQIVEIQTGRPVFSRDECLKLEGIMGTMFQRFGDQVHEAAYPVFMAELKLMTERS